MVLCILTTYAPSINKYDKNCNQRNERNRGIYVSREQILQIVYDVKDHIRYLNVFINREKVKKEIDNGIYVPTVDDLYDIVSHSLSRYNVRSMIDYTNLISLMTQMIQREHGSHIQTT